MSTALLSLYYNYTTTDDDRLSLSADHPESVAEHMVGVHSPEYDHEAFLGKAEAERFDQLPPAEARRRLG